MVLESVLNFFFLTLSEPVFPAPRVEETVFSPLYTFSSFVKYKVSIGAWIYLKAFCFDDCRFLVQSEVRKVDSSISTLFFKIVLAVQSFLCFHTNWEIANFRKDNSRSVCLCK